jgi:hypothetical protein
LHGIHQAVIYFYGYRTPLIPTFDHSHATYIKAPANTFGQIHRRGREPRVNIKGDKTLMAHGYGPTNTCLILEDSASRSHTFNATLQSA